MSDSGLEALWANVTRDWESDKAHAAFLNYCQAHDQLPEAAVRYRGMAGDRERGPSAEKRLKAVAALALHSLEATRTERPQSRRNWGAIFLIVVFSVGSIALLATL